MSFPDLSEWFSRVCYVLTVFLNSFLIYLTLKYTTEIRGTYRNMIATFSMIGIIFTTLDMLVRPLFYSYNGSAIYFTLGSAFRKTRKMAEWGLLAYATSYAVISAFLAVQFTYRACVVSRPTWTKHFDSWKLAIWILYSLLVGCFWGYAVILMYPDEASYDYVRDEVLSSHGVEIRGVACYIMLAYNGAGEEKRIRWTTVEGISITIIVLLSQYIIMVICGVIMYKKISGNLSSTSDHHEHLQKQFFKALVCQVSAPAILVQLPALIVLTAPFLDLKFSLNSRFIIFGFSAYPLIDTLIIFMIITDYRIAFKKFMTWLSKDINELMRGPVPVNGPPSRMNVESGH